MARRGHDTRERIRHYLIQCQSQGEIPTVREMGPDLELRAIRKDGTSFPAEISLCPIGTGDNASVAASIRDISRHKDREKQLRTAHERLAERLTCVDSGFR